MCVCVYYTYTHASLFGSMIKSSYAACTCMTTSMYTRMHVHDYKHVHTHARA